MPDLSSRAKNGVCKKTAAGSRVFVCAVGRIAKRRSYLGANAPAPAPAPTRAGAVEEEEEEVDEEDEEDDDEEEEVGDPAAEAALGELLL